MSMFAQFKKPPLIHGHRIPGRRFTKWAALYFTFFVALPILGITLALDLIGYLVAVKVFGASCYGLLCFL